MAFKYFSVAFAWIIIKWNGIIKSQSQAVFPYNEIDFAYVYIYYLSNIYVSLMIEKQSKME